MTQINDTAKPTLYFDGACALCSAEIGYYQNREGAEDVCFVDISQTDATPGADLSKEDALRRIHLRRADGTLVSGAAAFVEVWAQLKGWKWLAKLARLPGVTFLLEGLYRAFLPVRPALSRAAKALGLKPLNPQDAPPKSDRQSTQP